MRTLLLCALVLLACRKDAGPDRWPDVVKLATPTVPAAEGALLAKALERITDGDVPELALEDAIAWRKASGGLSWRGGRAVDDRRPLHAMRLGTALLERRGDDPEAVATVLYLGQRLRAEAPALIDIMVGFALVTKAAEKPWHASYAPFAPTEAEVRRAIAAEAVHFDALLNETPSDDASIGKAVRAAYAAMVVDAPRERAAYAEHIEAETAKALKSAVLRIVISPRLPTLTSEMFAALDTHQKWSQSL